MPFPELGPAVVRHGSGAEEVVLIRAVTGTQDGFTVGAIAALDGIWVEIHVREGGRVHVTGSAAAWRKLGKPIPSTEKDPWAPERLLIPEFAELVGVMADLGMRRWTGQFRLDLTGHEGDAERAAGCVLKEMAWGTPAGAAALSELSSRREWYPELPVEKGVARVAALLASYEVRLRAREARLGERKAEQLALI